MTAPISQDPDNLTSVLIFAGPNGSGKSTILAEILEDSGLPPEAYINADEIAKTLEAEIPDYRERNIRAAEIAEARRIAAIEQGIDFAFETVMSTPEKIALFTQAKARGYEVSLVFVTTNDPSINVARVANRVKLGGHAVKEEDVRERYRRAHELLACAVEHADFALVYDNSEPGADAVQVARLAEGAVTIMTYPDRDTAWVETALNQPWLARVASRSHLLQAMERDAADRGHECPPGPSPAVASNEAEYWGIAVAATEQHVLLVSAQGEYTIHDRQLLATQALQEGAWCCLQYRYKYGKIDRADLVHRDAPDVESPANSVPRPARP
jgi:predicted ABC-type ATPase